MSTREIIAELPRLTLAELHEIERRIAELTSRRRESATAELHPERIAGHLVLAGSQIVRQAEVDAILDSRPLHERLQKYQGAGPTGVKNLASNPKHLSGYGCA